MIQRINGQKTYKHRSKEPQCTRCGRDKHQPGDRCGSHMQQVQEGWAFWCPLLLVEQAGTVSTVQEGAEEAFQQTKQVHGRWTSESSNDPCHSKWTLELQLVGRLISCWGEPTQQSFVWYNPTSLVSFLGGWLANVQHKRQFT